MAFKDCKPYSMPDGNVERYREPPPTVCARNGPREAAHGFTWLSWTAEVPPFGLATAARCQRCESPTLVDAILLRGTFGATACGKHLGVARFRVPIAHALVDGRGMGRQCGQVRVLTDLAALGEPKPPCQRLETPGRHPGKRCPAPATATMQSRRLGLRGTGKCRNKRAQHAKRA